MRALNLTNNDHDYAIFVTLENRSLPDEPIPIAIPIPQVSILLNVAVSYNLDSDVAIPIRSYDARLQFEQPLHSFASNSRDIIAQMIEAMHIPFPLDRLQWKTHRFGGNTEPLESVEAMISKIAIGAATMATESDAGGPNKVGIAVTVEKEILVSAHQVFDEMRQLEVEVSELRDEMNSQLQRYPALLAIYEGGISQLPEGWAGGLKDGWDSFLFSCNLNGHLLSADDICRLEELLLRFSGLCDNVTRTCATMRMFLNRVRGSAGYILDNALTKLAMREWFDQAGFIRIPATKASVEALEKFVYDGGVHGSCSSQCVICLEKILSGEQVTRVPCSHIFHDGCIVQWFNSGHTCPLCRFKMPTY